MKPIYALLLSGLVFISCEKGDPDPTRILFNSPTPNIKYNQTHRFSFMANENATPSWKSSDEKIGTIDSDGIFKARKIGEATVTLTANGKSDQSKIIVSPYVTFLTEPVIDFGSSVADLKGREKRKIFQETDELLVYEGENSKVRLVSYYKQNGRITSCLVLFENTEDTVADATTFFKERYPDNRLVSNSVIHVSDDRKYAITLSVHNSLGFNAIYAQNSQNSRTVYSKSEERIRTLLADLLIK